MFSSYSNFRFLFFLFCGLHVLETQKTASADTTAVPSISSKECIDGKQDVTSYVQKITSLEFEGVTFIEPLCSTYIEKYETFSQLSSGGEKNPCDRTICKEGLCTVFCYPREPCKTNIIHVTPIYKPEYNITAGTYEVTFYNFSRVSAPRSLTCTPLTKTSFELTWIEPEDSCPVTSYSGNCTALSDPTNSISFTSSPHVLNHTFLNLISGEYYICVVEARHFRAAAKRNVTCKLNASSGTATVHFTTFKEQLLPMMIFIQLLNIFLQIYTRS